jgi:predicted component of type VI protein secretion system
LTGSVTSKEALLSSWQPRDAMTTAARVALDACEQVGRAQGRAPSAIQTVPPAGPWPVVSATWPGPAGRDQPRDDAKNTRRNDRTTSFGDLWCAEPSIRI